MLNLLCWIFSMTESGKLMHQLRTKCFNRCKQLPYKWIIHNINKLTNEPLTDQLNLTDRNLPELSNECWQTVHESCSQYHHGWIDQSLSTDVEQHHQQQFFSELLSPRQTHYKSTDTDHSLSLYCLLHRRTIFFQLNRNKREPSVPRLT